MHSKMTFDPHSYLVRVSQRFVALSILASILVAFAVGRATRLILVDGPYEKLLLQHAILKKESTEILPISAEKLSHPILKRGKPVPQTIYTSKNFDTSRSASIHSKWVVADAETHHVCDDKSLGVCNAVSPAIDELVDEEHLPAGHHLLVDIEHVDATFLNSEERLANAMLELIYQCDLTLLSYHCHKLQPSGVTCIGVLVESHVSFHTWPEHGVITLDLFTCGPNSLLSMASVSQDLFGVQHATPDAFIEIPKPHMVWAHKLRGFRPDDEATKLTDLESLTIGRRLDFKRQVSCTLVGYNSIP